MAKLTFSDDKGKFYKKIKKALDPSNLEHAVFLELLSEFSPLEFYLFTDIASETIPYKKGGEKIEDTAMTLAVLRNAMVAIHLNLLGAPLPYSWGDSIAKTVEGVFDHRHSLEVLNDLDFLGEFLFGGENPQSHDGVIYTQFQLLRKVFFKHHAHSKGWDISGLFNEPFKKMKINTEGLRLLRGLKVMATHILEKN